MKAFIAFIMLYDDEGLTSSTFFLRKAKAMREKFMETACERALNSLSWSLHYEPITCSFFFCWWKDENSFRAFHHLHPKIGRKTMPTEASSENKTACRIPEQSKRKAINRGIEGEAR